MHHPILSLGQPFIYLFIFLFIHERQRERGAEGEAGSQGAGSPMRDSVPALWDHELSRRQALNHLSHPGTQGETSLKI